MGDGNEQQTSEPGFLKEEVSFRLSVEVIEKLEEIIFHSKQEIPRDKAKKLTKSKVIELVLEAIIYDYEKGNSKRVISDIILCWADN